MTDRIYNEVNRIIRKYGIRDPFELLDAIGAVTRISHRYPPDGLKGYCTIMNRCKYAVINGSLNETDRRVAAGHEAAHLILHRAQLMGGPARAMRDFDLYDGVRLAERQANTFLADFLVTDADALEAAAAADDYFDAASELCIPAPLFAFKLYSLARRGHPMRSPADLDSRFLRP